MPKANPKRAGRASLSLIPGLRAALRIAESYCVCKPSCPTCLVARSICNNIKDLISREAARKRARGRR